MSEACNRVYQVANMHLKLLQPLLAIPLYTFVLRHAADGSRELDMVSSSRSSI